MQTRKSLILGLAIFSAHLVAFATTRYWTGAVSSDFYTATNWVPVGVPSSTDTIIITNGTVNISPPFTSSGQITWSNGTVAGLNLGGSAVLTISGLNTKYLAGQMTNAGTIVLSSPLEFLGGGRALVNQAGGLIDVQGDVGFSSDGNGGQQIVNAGTFRKSQGPNSSPVTGIAFQNSGTILALSGTIDLQSGGTLAGACTANIGTAVTFSGGTFAVTNSAVFSGGGFVGVAGGGPAFNGTLATAMGWTGGTVYGQWNIAANGLLAASGLGTRYLQAAVTNAGTITVAGPVQFNGANLVLANQAGGLIDVQGDVGFSSDGNGGQQIVNAGTFRKSQGPNSSPVTGIAFQNSGTILAQSGTIDLQSGGTLAGACTANIGTAVTFSGGTFAVTNSAVFSGGGFVGVAGGGPAFNGTLATAMGWTGGTVYGQWNIAANGLLAASGLGTRYLQAVVTNSGTITVASPVQFNGGNLLLVNQAGGLIDVQGDVGFSSDGNGGQQIVNAGTFRKSAGPNSCAVNGIAFRNSGTVGILAGQLYLNSPFTNSAGGLVVRLNGTADWGQLICSSSVVLGNPLQVSFASGYAPPVGGQYRIISGTSLTGVFNPVNIQSSLASVTYTTNSVSLTITNTIPQISSPVVSSSSFSFNVSTVNGESFTIERNDDMGPNNWIFYTNLVGNGSVMQVSIPVTGAPQRFFRVHQP